MKDNRISLLIVILILAALSPVLSPPATAALDTREKAEVVAMLTSSPWTFKTEKWTEVRVFKADGTFTTVSKPKVGGHWLIHDDSLLLNFSDGHQDVLTLPLYAKDTVGRTASGAKMIANLGAEKTVNSPSVSASRSSDSTSHSGGAASFGTLNQN